MKIFQSSIEKGLYILLLTMFILVFIATIILIHVNNQLDKQQHEFHADNVMNLAIIENNQAKQSQSIRIYIDCLLKIKPSGNVPAQEKVCFNKAPQIKS